MTDHLLLQARAGDADAFAALVDPFRHELHVHCYRFLGSVQDAEDALQETLVSAWRGLAGFEQRASVRTWLYAIATSRCLNMHRAAGRRPRSDGGIDFELPEPSELAEPLWLEPYPDVLLGDGVAGPEARYQAKEAISLAFVTALQLLPARQRAVLILRDVLGFRAAEVAAMLDSSLESVTSALKRARATLDAQMPALEAAPTADSPQERELVARLTDAFETNDIDAIVALLSDDVRLSMPPLPVEYRGLEQAAAFLRFVGVRRPHRRIVHTRANGQPALAMYARDPGSAAYRALGLLVVTISGERIAAITRFDGGLLAPFGLPRTLAE